MEAETIDLTDPLENLLRQTGMSPEYLQERIARLSEENAKEANANQKNIKDMTLSDLLDGFKCSNSKNNKEIEVTETIELSDDEVVEVIDDVKNKESNEPQEVTEVRVIEVNDQYDSECNDDDDDEFLEESKTDILHSNSKDVYASSSVQEEYIDNNLIENTSNILRSLDSAEYKELVAPLSDNRIFGNCDKIYDLHKNTNILIDRNDDERNASTNVNTKTLTNNCNAVLSITVGAKIIENETLSKRNESFTNEGRQQNQDNSIVRGKVVRVEDKIIQKNTIEKEGMSKSDNSKSEMTKKVNKSCNSKSSSSETSHKSTLSELQESICNKSSESDDKLSNDLGFIVSGVQGGVDLINSTNQITNIGTEETKTCYENKIVENVASSKTKATDNVIIHNKDETLSKPLGSSTEKENMEDVSYDQDSNIASTSGLQGIKSIEEIKTIDEVVGQLEIACREDNTNRNNFNELEINNVTGVKVQANNLQLSEESKRIKVCNHSLEIDSSTNLLLRSLDEAIKTCDNTNRQQEYAELGKKSNNTRETLPKVEDAFGEHQTKLDDIKEKKRAFSIIITEQSKNDEKLTNYSVPSCKSLGEVNNKFSTQSANYINSDNFTGDLLEISEDTLIKKGNNVTISVNDMLKPINKDEEFTDSVCSILNNTDQNSKHPLGITNFDYLNESSVTNDNIDISMDSKNDTISEAKINMDSKTQTEIIIKNQGSIPFSKDINNLSPIQIASDDNRESKNIQIVNNVVQVKTQQSNQKNEFGDRKTKPINSQPQPNCMDSGNSEWETDQLFMQHVDADSDTTEPKNSESKKNMDCINMESKKVISNQLTIKQFELQGTSYKRIKLINTQARENLIDSIRVDSDKVISSQGLTQLTDAKLDSSGMTIELSSAEATKGCLSVDLENLVSNEPLIHQTHVEEELEGENILSIYSSAKETLMDSIAVESEVIISNQLFNQPADVKKLSPNKNIDSINSLKEDNLTDVLTEKSEDGGSTPSLKHRTNALIKDIQPINRQAIKSDLDSIIVESGKLISDPLLIQHTDEAWELDKNLISTNSQAKNATDYSFVEPSSSKCPHNNDVSSLRMDNFVNTNLIQKSQEKAKFDNKSDSDEDTIVEENSVKNFEEIRKNLKLQLTSLRNKRRMDILQDVKTKDVDIEFSKSSLFSEGLKKLDSIKGSQKLNENIPLKNQNSVPLKTHPDITQSEFGLEKQGDVDVSIEQDLVSQTAHLAETPQFDFVIDKRKDEVPNFSSKQEFVPITACTSKEPQSKSVTENHEDEDVPNVFNEIRKIIRKQKSTNKISLLKSVSNLKDAVGNESQKNYQTESRKDEDINTGRTSTTIANLKGLQTLPLHNLENKNTCSVVISPFVSNTLDEFLTDAKLNVSYTIPKSGAEEGLRQNYADEPIMPPVIAEIKEEDTDKLTQETKYKPKTLAEKRRLLEKNKLKEKKRLEKLKKQDEAQKRSYVLFKDKKIFLKAKSMGKCIASIKPSIISSTNDNRQRTITRKPSLLTELYKKTDSLVKYRPGPLCKKHLLQIDNSNWTTELQTLPKVTLKVMPQLGKPIHPNLCHILPQWDGEVTIDQIEFALSALVTKEQPKQIKIFKFDVSYEKRQIQILTRKRILDKPPVKLEDLTSTKENTSNSEEDVATVMEKLLNYVEIKEIEPTLVRYDKDVITSDDGPVETEVPSTNKHVLIKRKSRFSKTDRELIRLNCKVVSVEVEENVPERQCSKPYCKLGCICKSLQCERIIGLHCQKMKCIFECTCPKEKDKIISIAEPTIRLPAGTDLLSMDTVTRIEGEAKRNLAKVEKEFIQTVIHTNNKTIVVGFGNKSRRATKTKKYTDFFDDQILKDETKETKKENILPVRHCSVALENWDFSDILPYCWVHYLYNCHCRGLSVFSQNISSDNCKKEASELLKFQKEEIFLNPVKSNVSTLINKKYVQQYPKQTVEESFKAIVRKSAGIKKNIDIKNDFEETLYSVTGRPLRKKKKIYEDDFVFDKDGPSSFTQKISDTVTESNDKTPVAYVDEPSNCSRTRQISKTYYRKVTTFTNAALYFDFANNLTQADLLKALQQENNDNISDSDAVKRTIIEERKRLLQDTETETRKKKRKQKIEVRQDENLTIKTTEKAVSIPETKRGVDNVKSVFKGEIIVNDSEWLKKLGQSAKQPLEGYARILPWTALLNGFITKAINIYCITDMPLRLLLNVGPKLNREKILDVETFGHKILSAPLKASASWLLSQSENVREIIKWLLSGSLPSRYKTTSLSFLLVETFPGQFEVRGLCTQGEKKPSVEENETDLSEEGELADQITEVKHKDMNGDIGSLFITKGKFRLRELVEDGCDDDHTDNLYMWVGLPEVYKIAKWRVVFLNNDFAYLYFKNIQYSIKYTDLVKLTDMAKEEMLTLVLKNVQIRRSYEHAAFGIYISHNYTDRIFIGPYFINYDDDEIETLRFINQQLVSSECFNRMTGNSNYRCGHWMYERTYHHTPTVYMKDTIDLTKDDTPPRRAKSTAKNNKILNSSISVPSSKNFTTAVRTAPSSVGCSTREEHIIYHNGMSIHIKNSKPRSPSQFNRFIITNIPHFGYLGAYQPDNSSILEVSWPFEKKVLEFENADNARDFLQERFNQLLQPVPESFKIQVIVLIQLDLKEHQPINSDFLSGHCICGYFGTYNFKELSEEFCQEKLHISKEAITKLFAKRAHAYIRKKIEELAEIVGIKPNDPKDFNVPTILNKAREEVKSQEGIRRQQVSEIQAYELEVVAKMKRLYEQVNNLPRKQRNIESKIINEILQIRPKRIGNNEIVEIKDDDDEALSQGTKSDLIIYTVESDDGVAPEQPKKKPLKRKRTKLKKTSNLKIIYTVESDDAVAPDQPQKKPLKRKRVQLKKTSNLKAAEMTPFASASCTEASTSFSIVQHIPNKALKTDDIAQNTVTNQDKQSIPIVKPPLIEAHPPSREDEKIITINEDTETIIINEDIETVIINEDLEPLTFNDDEERIKYNDDIEMITINEDMKPIIVNDHINPINEDKEIFNEGMDLETPEVSEHESQEIKNIRGDHDSNHYIIEYDADGYDPNVTEIIVAQSDKAENIDLSKATIIASVPPTSVTSDNKPITVSILSPEIQTPSIKTYSKKRGSFTIDPKLPQLDMTGPETKPIKPTTTSDDESHDITSPEGMENKKC